MISLDDGAPLAPDPAHRDLRRALGQFATGVAVATTCDTRGQPLGLTINSFASVSLDPALVLWSLARRAGHRAAFDAAERFGISVLASQQRWIAERFATPGADRFAGIAWWRGLHGLPLLRGASADFVCRVVNRVTSGDHVVLIGEVEAYRYAARVPLVFHAGEYNTLHTIPGAVVAGSPPVVAA